MQVKTRKSQRYNIYNTPKIDDENNEADTLLGTRLIKQKIGCFTAPPLQVFTFTRCTFTPDDITLHRRLSNSNPKVDVSPSSAVFPHFSSSQFRDELSIACTNKEGKKKETACDIITWVQGQKRTVG